MSTELQQPCKAPSVIQLIKMQVTRHNSYNECVTYVAQVVLLFEALLHRYYPKHCISALGLPGWGTWANHCRHCRLLLSMSLNKFLINCIETDIHKMYWNPIDIALVQIISQLFHHLLCHKDSAEYWMSNQFTSEKTKIVMLCFISNSIRSITKAIRHDDPDDPDDSFRKSAACISLHRFIYVFLSYIARGSTSLESWRNIGTNQILKKYFDKGVLRTRLCCRIIRGKYTEDADIWGEWQFDFAFSIQMYNELFLYFWERADTASLLDPDDFMVNMRYIRYKYKPIKCHWKQCKNRNKRGVYRFKKCKGCKYSRYCSVKCQKLDWNRGSHKQICALLCP